MGGGAALSAPHPPGSQTQKNPGRIGLIEYYGAIEGIV